ncbi:unnamed protein product [Paramecium primaurelia]|uniref:Uncharacterized protein n=1 Tax=Paramecium primaurelia TaxID=5886 RepID=A0A8S1MKK4_PARPR|nr:unnamed protein product [Paramecium primaurelia]
MFNASWIAPNLLTMQLSTNNYSNNLLENYPKLPLIPQKNQFLTSEKPQFRISQQLHHQNKQLTFKEIFEINKKNQELLNELMNALNHDLQYKQQQIYTNIQNQQDYELKVKPDRIRYPSVDNKIKSNRSLENVDKSLQVSIKKSKKKYDQFQNNSRTEKQHKKRNINSDSSFEIDNKQNYKYKVLNTKQLNKKKETQKYSSEDSDQSLIDESHQNKKLKFKTVGQVVFAAMCLSRKYRMLQSKKQVLRNQINQNYQEYQKVIDQFSKRQAIIHEKQYYAYVVEKVIYHLKEQSFIEETQRIQNQSKEYQSDLRKVHVFKFTTLLFKNVELYTRQNTITDVISSFINTSLYQQTGVPISKFVGQRCHFYNEDRLKIPIEQLVLIALEYYFFCNLIPYLFEIMTDIQNSKIIGKLKVKTNPFHLNECHFYICVLATLIQQKIVQVFSQMRRIKNPNGNIVQKVLKTTEQQNLVIKAQIAINNQLDDNDEENEIVKGLISSDLILALEEEKPQWKKFIDKTFSQIITNFRNILPK